MNDHLIRIKAKKKTDKAVVVVLGVAIMLELVGCIHFVVDILVRVARI